jgi:hypothetical protein
MMAPGSEFEPGPDRVVQERLEGRLVSTFTIARDGRALATSVYEAAVLSGSVAVCFRRIDDAGTVEHWVDRFVSESRHTGFIAFDFIIDDQGVARAIECNPRATSGIHFLENSRLPGLIGATDRAAESPLRKEPLLAESYSCFTAALGRIGRRNAATTWRALRDARDVTWQSDDPWPFLSMMINTWRLVWLAATRRMSFAQAAVLDIRWHGEDEAP